VLSRRGFVLSGVAVGGGLVIGYTQWRFNDGDAAAKFAASGNEAAPLNAWLKIDNSGQITCAIHRAEMGQGVTTSLAMLLAEELDADWSQMRFEFAPVDRDYYNFGMLLNGQPLGDPEASWLAGTGTWAMRKVFHSMGLSMTISSSSMIDAWDTLRPAGAAARHMLIAAAAGSWQRPAEGLRTESGWVIDDEADRRASYGELAESAAGQRPPSKPALKNPSQYRIIGKNVPRLDTPMKVQGAAEFGIDVTLPNMLYAAVVHSPIAGTDVGSFETNGAEELPGIERILLAGEAGKERAVAVVADNTWQAMQAATKISITPKAPSSQVRNSEDVGAEYLAMLDAPEHPEDHVIFREDGQADAVINASSAVVTAVYEVPFLAHACMEPMNCTAFFTGTELEVWAPTQAHSVVRELGAAIAGLSPDDVAVHTTFLGGGFGRRAEMDFAKQAMSVAVQMPGRPVKLTWSREQDIRHDAFRPAAVCRIRGTVDDDGALSAMHYALATQSVVASYETRTPTPRGAEARTDNSVVTAINPSIYPIENLKVLFAPVDSHVPAGYWRSVSHSWNTFFVESFIDEVAIAANLEPLAFRQQALKDRPRVLKVLNAVAEKIGAGTAFSTGRGFAVAESHSAIVAHGVEVATQGGKFQRVTRVVCAIDCGPVIHPDNVRAQMEGSVVDGLSAALYGQIDIRQGRAVQGNFDSYRRLRLADTPVIEVLVIDSQAKRPAGVGEPAVPGVAPALTNAIFNATGERIRKLPILRDS
jgi:isoquinoline 1-oxidoreductase beta subunit